MKKQLYISVTNSMAGGRRRTGERFLSGKKSGKHSGHGFGLLRIDSIAAKCHGYINRQTENGMFATEVMLPLVPVEESGAE